MKHLLSIIIILVVCSSCSRQKKESFTRVSISEIFTDSLSIRAIVAQDTSRVWFAANRGVVGLVDGNTP